jgi:PPOX class probable F420-dependent enzyme
MSVRLTDEEAWEMLANGHTGIFTTLRKDGWPVSLPMWFVVVDRRIYMVTMASLKKVARIRSNPCVSFLVESGKAWKDLAAVVVTARAAILDANEEESRRAQAALAAKYNEFRLPASSVPDATKSHYSGQNVLIRLDPVGPFITWNNAKIRLRNSP